MPHTEIRYAVGQCSLGALLVARSPAGLCAISLGDDADALAAGLLTAHPQARPDTDDSALAQVAAFIDRPGSTLALPLAPQGTPFQLRVWQALAQIAPGHTLSYTELAQRIGAPRAVRAVAGACAANPLAVAIPCHRVLRRDGALAGYRWGEARKRALLEREARLGSQP
ncbi:methylated-DNA--[protein]-cysteine S-methyltransferase [Zoogloea sp.]|uniref:methylated-DNA--[protein]-cysteine S-methyltransferase n=1 Tax=Zoogloea sp. TaxID=49181 RepID=UPI002617134F|nr:methylated-DNA--[protein]-cysteine S-methyltransferase [uncultured Zoogloea sp.]